MSSRKERTASARDCAHAFDVNSFLRKTLSNFDSTAQKEASPTESGSAMNTFSQLATASFSLEEPGALDQVSHSRPLQTEDSAENCLLLQAELDGHYNVRQQSRPTNSRMSNNNSVQFFGAPDRSKSKGSTPLPSRTSSASSLKPLCRICHLGSDAQGNAADQLISPCRCAGTMQFVHTSCLVHWLEISTKKMCPSPQCELCGYDYKTHHCFRLQKLHMPRCSHRDKILHLVFVIVLIVMIGCAGLSIAYLQEDKGYRLRTSLNRDDVIVISCSILFFCSFFVAVFTQYRAEASLCRLLFRCWLINEHWRIKNYDQNEDEKV